jgi:hypothetical protein
MPDRKRLAAVMLIPLTLAGCGGSSSTSSGSSAPAASGASSKSSPLAVAPSVSASLDGLSVLPARIHWTVKVSDPSQVSEVDFLVDGQKGWVEKNPPYFYGNDGNWLVTSFLTPGMHTFSARVTTVSGGSVTDTVKAATTKPASPPAALSGRWARQVTDADTKKNTSDQPPPAGLWGLTIDARGWHLTDPDKGGGSFDVGYLSGGRLDMRPTIEMPPYPNPTNGGFCDDTDPPATWSAAAAPGSTMTLHPIGKDPCGDRIAILEGSWTHRP